MPINAYYDATVLSFLKDDTERILGVLTAKHHHALEEQQRWAWLQQISILKACLATRPNGRIFLEFYIPRMGKRADVILIAENIVFVIEFKAGATEHASAALDQAEDYALDLKNFHEGSHKVPIVPVLVSTKAESQPMPEIMFAKDLVASAVGTNKTDLGMLVENICSTRAFPSLNVAEWMAQGYKPTPTIVQAAEVLYRTHSVIDISRSDAGAKNLRETSASVSSVVDRARQTSKKAICFVTGVPGSGKTLAGLNIATRRSTEHLDEHAVFLSGNGPLVDVLREALARDKVAREDVLKKDAQREVRSFIQNIHHFRDEYVGNNEVPLEKVVVFDEAQRAWTRKQAASFMQRKRGQHDFNMSEPEFLISVMDRHPDWCTVICLVGGGQEINTGEAGISEWINALESRFPDWEVYISSRMALPEYGASGQVERFFTSPRVHSDEYLHLEVSMRSFRAEALSKLIGHIIDNEPEAARATYEKIDTAYPIYLTRDLGAARDWLRGQARGTERFGLVASSGAQRLRPEGIYIKANIEPVNWFLNDREDVRSSYYLEDVASEFAVQGLELDWVGACWDGDFHHKDGIWTYQTFEGTKWRSMVDESRRLYLKNAYRVILTRARQGMILFVPKSDPSDPTRSSFFYDGTFEFLRLCGIRVLP
jgi:Schlafen group 3, DNA/RNA helicase domain